MLLLLADQGAPYQGRFPACDQLMGRDPLNLSSKVSPDHEAVEYELSLLEQEGLVSTASDDLFGTSAQLTAAGLREAEALAMSWYKRAYRNITANGWSIAAAVFTSLVLPLFAQWLAKLWELDQ